MRAARAWVSPVVAAALFVLLLGIGRAGVQQAVTRALGAVGCTVVQRPAAPGSAVDWMWSGGVTTTRTRIVTKLARASDQVRIAYAAEPGLRAPQFSAMASAQADSGFVVSTLLDDLAPATEYVYAVEVDGVIDSALRGRFRTFGHAPFSFDVVLAGDAALDSDAPVFDAMAALTPDLYLNMGDLFYADITTNNVDCFRAAFDRTLRAPRQANLYRSVPVAYVWDDHDFGPNNSDSTSPARAAARQAYRQMTPHYELAAGSGDQPIYQAFTVGRVRFILTDLRSARAPAIQFDGPGKSMLGEAQKAWFKAELLAAKERYPVIVWVSSVPWIASPLFFADHWGGYSAERAELARFIEENRIHGLVMLAADSHMVAVDDGRHNIYGPAQTPLFPVLHAAALNREGSVKGGPYSHGAFASPTAADGQFGLLRVEDRGDDKVCVSFSGRRLPAGANATVELVNWQHCFAADPVFAVRADLSFQNGVAPHAAYTLTAEATIVQADPQASQRAAAGCRVDGDDPPGAGHDVATLLRWDLGAVPPGARVKQAQIGLHVTDASDGPYQVYAMARDWSPQAVTWSQSRAGQAWLSAGAQGAGDREPAVLASLGRMAAGDNEFSLNEAGVAAIQQWIQEPAANLGLIIAGTSTRDGLDFLCGANAPAAQRPRLTLDLLIEAGHRLYLPLLQAR